MSAKGIYARAPALLYMAGKGKQWEGLPCLYLGTMAESSPAAFTWLAQAPSFPFPSCYFGIDSRQLICSLTLHVNGTITSTSDAHYQSVLYVKICQSSLGCLCGAEKVEFRYRESLTT